MTTPRNPDPTPEEALAAWRPGPYRVFEVSRLLPGMTHASFMTVFAHGIRIHAAQPVVEFVDEVKVNGVPVYQTKRIIHGFIDINEIDAPAQPTTPQ